jgi:hypothetical protein
MLALQGLHACQLIAAERPFALFSQRGGLTIQRIDVDDLLVELSIWLRREPVPDQVRFKVPLFSSRAAWRGEIWATMPRCMISSAISRPDQWLIGRSDCSGFSQARP